MTTCCHFSDSILQLPSGAGVGASSVGARWMRGRATDRASSSEGPQKVAVTILATFQAGGCTYGVIASVLITGNRLETLKGSKQGEGWLRWRGSVTVDRFRLPDHPGLEARTANVARGVRGAWISGAGPARCAARRHLRRRTPTAHHGQVTRPQPSPVRRPAAHAAWVGCVCPVARHRRDGQPECVRGSPRNPGPPRDAG